MWFASFGWVVLFAAALSAQSSGPSFEVVSIKPGSPAPGESVPPDRFRRSNDSIPDLIAYAYSVQRSQILGGPEWIKSERFEIEAKAPSVPTPDQMRAMVRTLLSDRFKLNVQIEKREMPVFALRMAGSDRRLGAQMKPTTADCERIRAERDPANPRILAGPDGRPLCATRMRGQPTANGVLLKFDTSGMTAPQLAQWLSGYTGRLVVDETALVGEFDIELSFAPGSTPSTSGGVGDDPPVFTAVQEQLGLRLVSTRASVEVVVIESVARPAAN